MTTIIKQIRNYHPYLDFNNLLDTVFVIFELRPREARPESSSIYLYIYIYLDAGPGSLSRSKL